MDEGQPIMDVSRPGATPASPTSRPVITSNQPLVKDPMMSAAQPVKNDIPITPVQNIDHNVETVKQDKINENVTRPTPEEYAEMTANSKPLPVPSNLSDQNLGTNVGNPETGHTLVNDQASFGHMKPKRSKKIIWIILFVLLLAAAGFAYYQYMA